MPAKRIPWFKVWIGATAHGKVRQLDDGAFRTWVELLDAAAQQPQRGRFDSRREAAAITRRPTKHIEALLRAGLMDERDDGLWMHDWDDWQRWRQEDSNDSPTTTDHPPNGHSNDSRTTTEPLLNGSSLRARVAKDVRREKGEVEEDVPRAKALSSASADATLDEGSVESVYEHYRAKVQPKSRLCPRKKIAARLKRFTVAQLVEGIDHFAADAWRMQNNVSGYGADWFFESDARAEQWLLLVPRAQNVVPIRPSRVDQSDLDELSPGETA